jgi:crotonobetainyl-CoA:carnitine CoA-transferase CaiB-like acyl-CoA transferase
MRGPLSGIRVIDASEVISGPLATMILADQGADVIKVETPRYGDESRQPSNHRAGMTALYMNTNHNKRAIALDLKSEGGREVFLDLIRGADVFVQNWRPGAAGRLKVAEEHLRAVNPKIIYTSISGFGEDGPYSDRPGYDPIFQALTGYAAAQCNPQMPLPDLMRNSVIDKATSQAVAQAITAALFARERGEEPQHVRVAMLDAGLAFFWPDGMLRHTLMGDGVKRFVVPGERYQIMDTADGKLVIWMSRGDQQRAALRAVGRADLADDPRHRGLEMQKPENEEERAAETRKGLAQLSTEDAYARMLEQEVPAAPVLSHEEVLEDAQLRHNGTILEAEHEVYGAYRRPRPAARFSTLPYTHERHPSLFAEDTDEVLRELGYDDARIAALRQSGALEVEREG